MKQIDEMINEMGRANFARLSQKFGVNESDLDALVDEEDISEKIPIGFMSLIKENVSTEDIYFLIRYFGERDFSLNGLLYSFDQMMRLTKNVKLSSLNREICGAAIMAKTLIMQRETQIIDAENKGDFLPILNGYKEAYNLGNIFAGFWLGYLHCYGIGVDVDRQKAIEYFEDTISLIDWQATGFEIDNSVKGAIYYHLGHMLMNLDDVDSESNIWATNYFKESSECGNELADAMLEKLSVPTK